MITALAHAGLCVRDLDAAVAWYTEVLGLELLAPPTRMAGPAIERDMGEMIPGVVLRAAILGFSGAGDRVLELIEYPEHPGRPAARERTLTDHGVSHLGLVCDDLDATRARLEERGAEFLTRGTAGIAGLRTTWLRDPWGVVLILMEKTDPALPYFEQWRAGRG